MKKDYSNFGIIANTDGPVPTDFLMQEAAQQNNVHTESFMTDNTITEAERTKAFGDSITAQAERVNDDLMFRFDDDNTF